MTRIPAKSPPSRFIPALPWIGGGVVLLVVALAGAIIWAIVSLLGPTLTRADFPTNAEAASFVSDHLPAPLPTESVVKDLVYDRFTDWHLRVVVDLGTPLAVDRYLIEVRKEADQNEEYCGSSESEDSTRYFLPKWHACGSIERGDAEGLLRIRCNTR